MSEAEVAIALAYDPAGQDLPRVTASGRGLVARQMLAAAEHHGVPVQHDAALAELLRRLDIGSPIPIAAFAAVAEILAHLYRTDRTLGRDEHAPEAAKADGA